MKQPEIALLLTTYQKPSHLQRVLESIAVQRDVDGRYELAVADDGSTDETAKMVDEFRRRAPFRVVFTTHPHTTFHPARSRNEAAAATSAPYLLLLDGDCVLPADHVRIHLEHRKPNTAMLGDCCRLDQATSDRITLESIRTGEFVRWVPEGELRRLAALDRKRRFYSWLRHRTKPKLISNNVGIWRSDYERVNGFDENYQGWGCEDDDLGQRLRQSGVRLASILRYTRSYHIWHPRDVTAGSTWRDGPNVEYFLMPGKPTRCVNGLVKPQTSQRRAG